MYNLVSPIDLTCMSLNDLSKPMQATQKAPRPHGGMKITYKAMLNNHSSQ